MAKNQRLNATITIGAAMKGAVGKSIGTLRTGLNMVGDEIKNIRQKQSELSKQRSVFSKHAKEVAGLDQKLAGLAETIQMVEDEQRDLGKQRELFIKEGKSVEALDADYAELTRQLKNFKEQRRTITSKRDQYASEAKEIDRLDTELEGYERTLKRVQAREKQWRSAMSASAEVGRKYRDMTSNIGSTVRGASVVIGGAAASIFTLTNSTASLGDNTAKTADKLGVHVETLQEYRYAAERSGVASKTFDMALQRMTRRLAEAKNGTGEAKGAIEELGLDAQALGNMAPNEALDAIADRLSKVKNQSDRVRLAFKFFDSEGVAMVNMLKDGSAGLQQLRMDARATGYVLSEQAARDAEKFKDEMLNTQLALGGLKNIIGSALMPVVTDLMGQLTGWLAENRGKVQEFSKNFAEGFKEAVPNIVGTAKGIAKVVGAVGTGIGVVAGLVGGFDHLAMIVGGLFAANTALKVVMFTQSLFAMGAALVPLTGGLFPAIASGIGLVAGAMKAVGVAMLTNPIGVLITGIAVAVAGATYLIVKNWDWIKEKAGILFGYLKTALSFTPIGMVIKHWEPIKTFFSDLWGGIKDIAGAALDWVFNKISKVGGLISEVRKFLGFGGGEQQAAATVPNARAAEVIGAVAPAGGSTPAPSNTVTHANQITINTQPGQSPQQIVDEIERRQREREQANLFDGAMAYG